MNHVNGQFIILPYPFDFKGNSLLKYPDILIYISIRSFNNEFDGCFPSYESIAKRAGCSRDYVIKAVKRLEKAGMISVKRSRKRDESNRYTFPTKIYQHERIPYHIFDADLSMTEKSMLLCVRQFINKQVVAGMWQKLSQVSDSLGLSYRQVYKPFKSLIRKGYIEKRVEKHGVRYYFTDKIPWIYDYRRKPSDEIIYSGMKIKIG